MGLLRWLIGGLIGGVIGGAIWIAVGYWGNAEVGWIAWGVGGLVGLGVRAAAGEEDGPAPGAIAVIIAVSAILASKYIVIDMAIDREIGGFDIASEWDSEDLEFDSEDTISAIAYDIVEEREAEGETIEWPDVSEDELASIAENYPPEIWSEAEQRWDALSPEDQAARTEQEEAEAREASEAFSQIFDEAIDEAKGSAFVDSFSLFDLLWFGLAAFTAFRIGSGLRDGE